MIAWGLKLIRVAENSLGLWTTDAVNLVMEGRVKLLVGKMGGSVHCAAAYACAIEWQQTENEVGTLVMAAKSCCSRKPPRKKRIRYNTKHKMYLRMPVSK